MGSPKKTILTVAGVILILCLPVFMIGGGIVAYYFPREYYSKATIELHLDADADHAKVIRDVVGGNPKRFQITAVRGTDLVDIGVYDTDPQKAADDANSAAALLKQRYASLEHPAQIHERAVKALSSSRPNIPTYMLLVTSIGAVFAAIGIVLIIAGFRKQPSYA